MRRELLERVCATDATGRAVYRRNQEHSPSPSGPAQLHDRCGIVVDRVERQRERTQSSRGEDVEDSDVGRILHGNDITGPRHGPEREIERVLRSVRDVHVFGGRGEAAGAVTLGDRVANPGSPAGV